MNAEPNCGSIMTIRPVTVRPTDSVRSAMALLLEHRQLALPVVDPDGLYRGMFLRSVLITRLLPRITQMEERLVNVARIVEAMAASETVADLQARFRNLADDPVERYVDTQSPVLRPDTPLIATVYLLHRARTILPVVEDPGRRLVGVVSAWDLLARLSAAPA